MFNNNLRNENKNVFINLFLVQYILTFLDLLTLWYFQWIQILILKIMFKTIYPTKGI